MDEARQQFKDDMAQAAKRVMVDVGTPFTLYQPSTLWPHVKQCVNFIVCGSSIL